MSSPPWRSTVSSASAVELGAVAHVRRAGDRAGEAEVVAAAGGEAEQDATVGEHPGDGGADAPARAGDERDLSFEAGHGALSFTFSRAGYSARKRG